MSERQGTTVEVLRGKRCVACDGGTPKVSDERVREVLEGLPGWERKGEGIEKTYRFKNYYGTVAFVNATAWISHAEDHHPDLVVGYNRCTVRYSTHAIKGLSENDLICAAKVEGLVGAG